MIFTTAMDTFRGEDVGRRVQHTIELRLNQGWDVQTSFVYKDGATGIETVHVIFSRPKHEEWRPDF